MTSTDNRALIKDQLLELTQEGYAIDHPGWEEPELGCWHDYVVETTNEHDIVPIIVELPKRALGAEKEGE